MTFRSAFVKGWVLAHLWVWPLVVIPTAILHVSGFEYLVGFGLGAWLAALACWRIRVWQYFD